MTSRRATYTKFLTDSAQPTGFMANAILSAGFPGHIPTALRREYIRAYGEPRHAGLAGKDLIEAVYAAHTKRSA